jgi:hypothetical protein
MSTLAEKSGTRGALRRFNICSAGGDFLGAGNLQASAPLPCEKIRGFGVPI